MHYRYQCLDCGKTYIGLPSPGMMCNCVPAKPMIGTQIKEQPKLLSADLQEVYDIGKATKKRGELCAAWGIANKSHKSHGSNFAGNQTLAQLIQNIVAPVTAVGERQRVRLLIIQQYGYDIDLQGMV